MKSNSRWSADITSKADKKANSAGNKYPEPRPRPDDGDSKGTTDNK